MLQRLLLCSTAYFPFMLHILYLHAQNVTYHRGCMDLVQSDNDCWYTFCVLSSLCFKIYLFYLSFTLIYIKRSECLSI
jgi:hypothetical protein